MQEQYGQQNIVQVNNAEQLLTTCRNNILLPMLFIVNTIVVQVNNAEQYC